MATEMSAAAVIQPAAGSRVDGGETPEVLPRAARPYPAGTSG